MSNLKTPAHSLLNCSHNLLKIKSHTQFSKTCAHKLVNFVQKCKVVNCAHELEGNTQFCMNRRVCMELSNSVLAVHDK